MSARLWNCAETQLNSVSPRQQMRRHLEASRGDARHLRPEAGEAERERMHGAAVAQVADQRHAHITQLALLPADGVEVQQRLRGVLVRPVPRVDDWNGGVVGGDAGAALERMADDDDVGVGLDDTHGVGDGLALCH